jgi:hypothetical protein
MLAASGKTDQAGGCEVVDGRRTGRGEGPELGDRAAVDRDDESFAATGPANHRRHIVAQLTYADSFDSSA